MTRMVLVPGRRGDPELRGSMWPGLGTISKPAVDELYQWCEEPLQRHDFSPKSAFTKALQHTLVRERALRVFLEDPAVPLDTNHLERGLRPIPMGRKNGLFC